MSLKSIEMQVALPRTQEFGKMQEQNNQRLMINQHLDSEEKKLKAALDRHKSEKTRATGYRFVADDEHQKNRDQQNKRETGSKKNKTKDSSGHPFKGKHIDLSL